MLKVLIKLPLLSFMAMEDADLDGTGERCQSLGGVPLVTPSATESYFTHGLDFQKKLPLQPENQVQGQIQKQPSPLNLTVRIMCKNRSWVLKPGVKLLKHNDKNSSQITSYLDKD